MTDHEVERALGYTPCVCGVLDGTWHSRCYLGKTQRQIDVLLKQAISKARQQIQSKPTDATDSR